MKKKTVHTLNQVQLLELLSNANIKDMTIYEPAIELMGEWDSSTDMDGGYILKIDDKILDLVVELLENDAIHLKELHFGNIFKTNISKLPNIKRPTKSDMF